MDYSRFFFGDDDDDDPSKHQQQAQPSPKKELHLQGPRPSPLRVAKDSHAIRKPPRHPLLNPAHNRPPPAAPSEDQRRPVIIYAVSPKVIHVEESNFMSLVQRLTGLSPSGPRLGQGDVSPAARFASIEKASPRHRQKTSIDVIVEGNQEITNSAVEGFDLAAGRGTVPGILSPAPSSLLGIPGGIFSPVSDPPTVPLFQDLLMSPFLHGGSGFMGGGGFVSSPSAWFSSTMISPSPTSLDLYNLLADF